MPKGLESTVSTKDIEYLKGCGILAPDRWPEAPTPTQAQAAWEEAVNFDCAYRRGLLEGFAQARGVKRFLEDLNRGIDGPDDGPKL